jgi:exonuclease III
LGGEKSFELSVTKLIRYAVIIICIYRSPDGKIDTFFNKLELVIQKLMEKHKTLILWGDWNINLFQHSSHTRDLNNLLLQYNCNCNCNLFHPFKYTCNMGHVGYSIQFTYFKTLMKSIHAPNKLQSRYT